MRSSIHLLLHFIVPLGIALAFYRSRWRSVALIMIATMLVDLDHLLATPIYDPNRCSIGFHPLHSWPAIAAYALLLVHPKTRVIAIGLYVHMALDGVDCVWMRWAN